MAHAYAHLFAIPASGLRFFTVYGPWGRPDMAIWLFTAAILEGRPVRLFNHGRMRRDFTYVDDVVEAVLRLLARPPAGDPAWSAERPDPATSLAPWCVYNVGNNRPVGLEQLIGVIEAATGRAAIREFVPMQPGDVEETCADVSGPAARSGSRRARRSRMACVGSSLGIATMQEAALEPAASLRSRRCADLRRRSYRHGRGRHRAAT
jgi:UDP-glucuronate 4-epimerase